jgi:hypothetical protein
MKVEATKTLNFTFMLFSVHNLGATVVLLKGVQHLKIFNRRVLQIHKISNNNRFNLSPRGAKEQSLFHHHKWRMPKLGPRHPGTKIRHLQES